MWKTRADVPVEPQLVINKTLKKQRFQKVSAAEESILIRTTLSDTTPGHKHSKNNDCSSIPNTDLASGQLSRKYAVIA